MRTLILALILGALAALIPTQSIAAQVNDKALHVAASGLGTYLFYRLYRTDVGLSKGGSVLASIVTVNAIGLAKEFMHDSRPDINDIMANVGGSAIISFTIFAWEFPNG